MVYSPFSHPRYDILLSDKYNFKSELTQNLKLNSLEYSII